MYTATVNFGGEVDGKLKQWRAGDKIDSDTAIRLKLVDKGLATKDVVQPNIKIKHT